MVSRLSYSHVQLFIYLLHQDYQMNLLITNGIAEAQQQLTQQLVQLYRVYKTVELWKVNDHRTSLIDATTESKSNVAKNDWVFLSIDAYLDFS
jgi:hypothetical protein